MLSNKDFAKLLSTPSGSGGGGSKDKERFDLKTIKQWDNQIKAKMKNQHRDQDDWEDDGGGLSRSKGKGGGSSGVSRAGTGDTSASSAYRDRALERRLEANPDYAVSFEAAAKMDVDTSKYFGGDAEHTHLVKGLDHALLQKMKQQKQISTTPMTVHNRDSTKASHEYVPATELGARLKQVLHMHSARTGPTVGTRSGSSTAAPSRPRAPLSILPCAPAARNAYEVELDVLSEQDVPTTVLRSAKDITDNDLGQYIIPPDLLNKLAESLRPENRTKFLAADKGSKQISSMSKTTALTSKPVVVDAIGDIFEGVGKYYDSTAAIVDSDTKALPSESNASSYTPMPPTPTTTTAQLPTVDMFGGDETVSIMPTLTNGSIGGGRTTERASSQKISYFGGSGASETKEANKADLMAPVKELLRNQYLKEQAAAAQSKLASLPPKMVEEKGKVHRDIIGGGGGAAADRRYDLAMASGSYDVAGEMEVFEDDGSDDEGGGRGGRGKVGAKSKASGAAAASGISANPHKKSKKSSNHFEED